VVVFTLRVTVALEVMTFVVGLRGDMGKPPAVASMSMSPNFSMAAWGERVMCVTCASQPRPSHLSL
jgi:hypothetical protein